jgi:hypothetical protein
MTGARKRNLRRKGEEEDVGYAIREIPGYAKANDRKWMEGTMKSFSATCLLVLALVLVPSMAWPCSGFTSHDSTTVLVGNNEDFSLDFNTIMVFQPASTDGYGFVMWGYDDAPVQGGMNDQGLFLDGFATPHHHLAADPGTIPVSESTVMEMMRQSATVDEAVAFLQTYRLSEWFAWSQLFIVDANGDSVVFEGDVVNTPTDPYHIVTNFLPSRPELGGHPCPRYDAIEAMMTDSAYELTVEYFTAMAEAAHQSGYWYTRYTTVCDLVTLECQLMYERDFGDGITIDLADELALGYHVVYMADLFAPPPEVEEEPEPVAEPVPEVAEIEDVTEPVPDATTDPATDVAEDPAVDTSEPEMICEEGGCGCAVVGGRAGGAAGASIVLLLLAAAMLLSRRASRRISTGMMGLALATVVLVAGCDTRTCIEADSGVDTAVDSMLEPDTVVDTVDDPGEEEVDVEGAWFVVLEEDETGSDVPVPGATVSLDAPFAVRDERVTGADGRVVFPGVEWTSDRATVQAHKPGYIILSLLNVDEDRVAEIESSGEDIVLRIEPLDDLPADPVTISGTAIGFTDSAHPYVVSVIRPGVPSFWMKFWSGQSSDTFSVSVPRDTAFTLMAVEMETVDSTATRGYDPVIYRVMLHDFPATDGPITDVVLDFDADEVSLSTAALQVSMPTRAASPLRSGNAECHVGGTGVVNTLGWSTALEFDPDNDRLDVSFVWVEPDWVEDPYTYCMVLSPEWASGNVIGWSGYPDEGEPELAVDAPIWANPIDPFHSVPLDSILRWGLFDTDLTVEFTLLGQHRRFWTIHPGVDAMVMTIPEAPSSTGSEGFFDYSGVYGTLRVGIMDEADHTWRRFAEAQPVILAP